MPEPIDAWCERTFATGLAEPVTAATEAAVLTAAIVMWRRTAWLPQAWAMSAVLAVIAVRPLFFTPMRTG
jgi:hypothetical protein